MLKSSNLEILTLLISSKLNIYLGSRDINESTQELKEINAFITKHESTILESNYQRLIKVCADSKFYLKLKEDKFALQML